MELKSRAAELERLGFVILSQDDEHIDAIRCRWHLDLMFTQLTVAVRVRRVAHVDDALLAADREALKVLLDTKDPSILPRGFQKGRASVATYLCDGASASAREAVMQAPSMQFSSLHIAGLRDGSGIYTYEGTRLWGAIFYPLLKFIVRAALDPQGVKEPVSLAGIALGIFVIASIGFGIFTMATM